MFFNKKNKLKTWEKMASENEEAGELSLNLLPEGCIANVLSFTSPLAACRLSIVSPLFRSAAETGAFWERFLPRDLLSESDSPLLVSSKKQLYLSLCGNPILIEDGKKVSVFIPIPNLATY
jgi:hypothetical protein